MNESDRAHVGHDIQRASAAAERIALSAKTPYGPYGVSEEIALSHDGGAELRHEPPPPARPVVQAALESLGLSVRQTREALDVLAARLEIAGVLRNVPKGDQKHGDRPSVDVPLADGILGVEGTALGTRNLVEHLLSRLEI